MKYTFLLALAAVTALNVARAQTGDPTANAELAKVGAPSPKSALAASNAVQLNVSSGESDASIKLSHELSNGGDRGSRIAFIASAPVNKGNSTFASLDGLSNGTTLEVRSETWRLAGVVTGTDKTALAWCKANLEPLYEKLKKSLDGYECDLQTVDLLVEKGMLDPAAVNAFRRLFFRDDAAVYSWGFSGKFGYQDIDYYDPTNLSKQDTRQGVWAAGFYVSTFRILQGSVFSASINVARAANQPDQQIRCLPAAPNTVLTSCANGIFGEPGHKLTNIASFEYRQRVLANMAFALQLSRDIRNRVSYVQLPVYFVQSDKKGLTGGISAGWNSKDRKATAGIFIGQAFSWFGSD